METEAVSVPPVDDPSDGVTQVNASLVEVHGGLLPWVSGWLLVDVMVVVVAARLVKE